MSNVVIIGAQWGDEGKGKIVDWLCEKADIVVRFQGGHNAGHTIVIDNEKYKLSLLPSGIMRAGKLNIIGNGVVVDATALLAEIAQMKKQGIAISADNLKIAENANLILPLHQALDILREDEAEKTKQKIGTTRRGIGPAYEDKVGRRAIRFIDLQDENILKNKIEKLLLHHNAILRGLGKSEIKHKTVFDYLISIKNKVLPFCAPIALWLEQAKSQNKKILFEGAQGSLLDIDHGTYPFVTSSNVVAAQAAIGTGLGVGELNHVLGITKAYATRVGEGPFPTEQQNEIGEKLGQMGQEFGTVTGRKRRCGWLDLVALKHAVRINGINSIVLTKLDVLDEMDEIKICTKYQYKEQIIEHFTLSQNMQHAIKPIYQPFSGWKTSTKGIKKIADLPINAIKYIQFIEKQIGVKISLISTSPHRDDTILVADPFAT